jgi:hypothetical protein
MPIQIILHRLCGIAAITLLAGCTSKEIFVRSWKKSWKEHSEYYSAKEHLKDTTVTLPAEKFTALISKEILLTPTPFRSLVYQSSNENMAVSVYTINGNLELELELKEIKKKLFYKDLQINQLKSSSSGKVSVKVKTKIITKKIEVLPWYFKPLIYACSIVFLFNLIQLAWYLIKVKFRLNKTA